MVVSRARKRCRQMMDSTIFFQKRVGRETVFGQDSASGKVSSDLRLISFPYPEIQCSEIPFRPPSL
jgi:hypothetical protein